MRMMKVYMLEKGYMELSMIMYIQYNFWNVNLNEYIAAHDYVCNGRQESSPRAASAIL